MSKEINKNYTPALDTIVEEFGGITALVFGRIWRYCQGQYDECFASQDTIAKDLKLSRVCVNQHIKKLIAAGYLAEDERPGITNRYTDTGKAVFRDEMYGKPCKRSLQPDAQADTQPVNVVYNTCKRSLQPPVNDVYTKKDIKKESKKDELEYESEPDEVFSRMQQIVETLTGRLTTPGDAPTLDKFVAEGVTSEDIRAALAWRADQKLRAVANIHQLESGVLRNKAERVQTAAASAAKPAGAAQPAKKETALDRTKAALQKVMAEALLEEERNGKQI